MARQDWLVGADRRTEAVERIYAAAAELVSQQGFEAFTINALSAKVHCSPATIYRNVGGKAAILEGVIHHMSVRIVERITDAIADLEGPERVVTAIVVALDLIRAEPLGPLMMGTIRPGDDSGWLTASPLVAAEPRPTHPWTEGRLPVGATCLSPTLSRPRWPQRGVV
jgi:AcrR family transcriptional regulator